MKKIFSFFAAVLFAGSMMAETATMAAGTNGSTATVNEKPAIKVGTSKAGGDMTITVGAGATKLSFYAAAWKGVTGLSLNITPEASVATASVALTPDDGISNNSPFTLSADESTFLCEIDLVDITAETTLTLTPSEAKRFVVWGAEYIAGEGGDPTPTKVTVAIEETEDGFAVKLSDQTVPYIWGLVPAEEAEALDEIIAEYAELFESYEEVLEYLAEEMLYMGDIEVTWDELKAQYGDYLTYGDKWIFAFSYAEDEDGLVVLGSNVATKEVTYADPNAGSGVFTTNVEFVAGTNSYLTDKIIIDGEEYDAFKIGTSKNPGSCSVILPKGTTKFSFYAIGWSKSGDTDLTISGAYEETVVITGANISGNSPYTFDLTFSSPEKHFYSHTFAEPLEEDSELVFSCDYRAVFFGANVEGDIVTGFNNTVVENVVKTMENGQLVIIRGGVRYNAQGIRF